MSAVCLSCCSLANLAACPTEFVGKPATSKIAAASRSHEYTNEHVGAACSRECVRDSAGGLKNATNESMSSTARRRTNTEAPKGVGQVFFGILYLRY